MVSPGLLSRLVSTKKMDAIFSDARQIQEMARFELALLQALQAAGIAPEGASEPLAAILQEPFLNAGRAQVIMDAARDSGNVAIPFVKLLTQALKERSPESAYFLHLGATSQDVLDSALCLQMKDALDLLSRDLEQLRGAAAVLAETHAETLMAGRTWLQQGPPITLGLKAAGWVAALDRQHARLRRCADQCLLLQFGGAVGTLAVLGDRGLEVSRRLAETLGLREPLLPWHTQRDNLVEIAGTLANAVGTLSKMARDISLLMQTEVGEVLEPGGAHRGGSSTMPHKRNPVGAAAVLAAGIRAPGLVATMYSGMALEHERGLGGWQAEWSTLPELFRLTAGALAQMNEMVAGLEVHPEKMAANLAATRGLALAEAVSGALTPQLGRDTSHQLLESAVRYAVENDLSLAEALRASPQVMAALRDEDVDRLLDPRNYLGSTSEFIARALRATPKGR